jgi:Domain of unknown function (DUF1844)
MECKKDLDDNEIDFTTFILSLSSSVLVALGDMPNPETNETLMDLCLAKETIQIIELVQTKTRGNLTEEERGLLNSVLLDLRFKYVNKIKKK